MFFGAMSTHAFMLPIGSPKRQARSRGHPTKLNVVDDPNGPLNLEP